MKTQKPESLPISQRDIAAYLGISSSLLSMTATGRHGSRQLSTASSKKFTDLLLAHAQSQKPNPQSATLKKMQSRSANVNARLAKVMLMNAEHAEAHVVVLRHRLDEMAKNEQQDMHWMNTVDLLLAKLTKTRESANDRIWLENQQVVVLKRLQKNDLTAQVKLEALIETKKAMARICRDGHKKLLKK